MKDFLIRIVHLIVSLISLFAWLGFTFVGFVFLSIAFHVTSIQLLITVGIIVLAIIIGCRIYDAVQLRRKNCASKH